MKTMTFELANEIFNGFELLNEEMMKVRGGDNEPIVKPSLPPVLI